MEGQVTQKLHPLTRPRILDRLCNFSSERGLLLLLQMVKGQGRVKSRHGCHMHSSFNLNACNGGKRFQLCMHDLFAKSMLLVSSRITLLTETALLCRLPEFHRAHIYYTDISDDARTMNVSILNRVSTEISQMTIRGQQQNSLGWIANKV